MNCFSFLFGDGNPNLNLEERKWQLIAQVIKTNNGVVTAEQLAPYTGADPSNDDGVLPVLARFDGRPEVTDSGNIVYLFESLQVTAKNQIISKLPTALNEFKWKFTDVPAESLTPVYILAGVNFCGSWWLLIESHRILGFLFLIKLLVAYGVFFVLVPTVRYFVLQWLNKRIEERNSKRQDYAVMLKNPSKELLLKLGEAKQFRIGEKKITAADVIYTTDKDALDQADDLSEQFRSKNRQAMVIKVSELNFYPIKSCAGTALETAAIGLRGIEHDREWMIVDASNDFLTQRELPKMCLIEPTVESTNGQLSLSVRAPSMPPLIVPARSGQLKTVTVWKDSCQAV